MSTEDERKCRDCLSRRQFLTRSALVAAAAAIAAGCGNGQIGPDSFTAPSGGSSSNGNTIKVGDFPQLATVGTLVKVNSFQAVKRTGTDTFAAYSMVCTHQGCLTQLSSNMFFCPCHGAEFNSSGQVIRGPASRSLGQYATSYDPATDLLTIG
jgi:cytochrome b6-f complex iron-sulfur subunit